jgi:hypothetical protein
MIPFSTIAKTFSPFCASTFTQPVKRLNAGSIQYYFQIKTGELQELSSAAPDTNARVKMTAESVMCLIFYGCIIGIMAK